MTSLREILGLVPPISTVKAAIAQGMAQALAVVFVDGQLTPSEWVLAHEIAEQLQEMAPVSRRSAFGTR
jgi:hypothetical protein